MIKKSFYLGKKAGFFWVLSLIFFPVSAFSQSISVFQNLVSSDKGAFRSGISGVLDIGYFDGSSYREGAFETSQAQLDLNFVRFSRIFNLYSGVRLHLNTEPRFDRFLGHEDEVIDEASLFIETELGNIKFGKFYGPEDFRNLPGSFLYIPSGINGHFRHLETAQSGKWFDGYSSNFLKLRYKTPDFLSFSYSAAITFDSTNYDDPAQPIDDSGPVKGLSVAANYDAKYISLSVAFAELSQNIKLTGSANFSEEFSRGSYAGFELHLPWEYDLALGYNLNTNPTSVAGGTISSDYKSVIHGGVQKSAFGGKVRLSGAIMDLRTPIDGDSKRLLSAFGYKKSFGLSRSLKLDFYMDFLTEVQAHQPNEIFASEIIGSSGVDSERIIGFRLHF